MVGEEGEQLGVLLTAEAIDRAEAAGMDLVEVSPNVEPPVCKIMDYGKYKFQLNKKQAAAKKKQKQVHLKEIKFRPGTEEADFQVKVRKMLAFIEKGDKVKATIRFRGREMQHQELGMQLMARLKEAVLEQAAVESEPKFEGKQIVMVIVPKK